MKTTLSWDFRLTSRVRSLIHPRRVRMKRIVFRRTIFQFGRPPGRFAPTYDRPELPSPMHFLDPRAPLSRFSCVISMPGCREKH